MDAIKKVQPATLPRSAHAFECSLRHPLGKICTCGMGDTAKPAPAPLPEFASFAALADKAADNAFEVIAQLRANISDLTRRLAEATAELAARTRLASNAQDALRHARAEILSRFTHMEFADRQADANIWVYDLEALCSGLEYQLIRAEAAEARVRELEAALEERADAAADTHVLHNQGCKALVEAEARVRELEQQGAELGDEVLRLRMMVACDEDCEALMVEQNAYTHQCIALGFKTLIVDSFGSPCRCAGCLMWEEEDSIEAAVEAALAATEVPHADA